MLYCIPVGSTEFEHKKLLGNYEISSISSQKIRMPAFLYMLEVGMTGEEK